jgi:hypothetical protein
MKPILAVFALTVAFVPAANAQPTAKTAETCYRDVKAVIAGEERCLGVGEYCKSYDARDYLRYGFECVGHPARLRRRRY